MSLNRNVNKFNFQFNTLNKNCFQPFSYTQAMKDHRYKFIKSDTEFYLWVFLTGEWIPFRGIKVKGVDND